MTRMVATLIYVFLLYQRNVGRVIHRSHVPQPLESEEEDDESYFASGFTWESVVIGYNCGLVVGTFMCSIMFKAGKPKWFLEGIIPRTEIEGERREV
ncbi:hypothetical protein KY290_021752 [Solanum tuberosum]|uniref:Uncharacterized protein n=1 Tax=Solanum tuberosum TaxID=4113 RepID=A0ABQ7V407_SOLTU|nr:hypothetical protein KY289_020915 [Solanum tuberosum]KAH0758259.1 hypothetical protein KY290_021752 [Solanum tuberosum]